MQVSQAMTIWLEYHRSSSKQNTLRAYQAILSNFTKQFSERNLDERTSGCSLIVAGTTLVARKDKTQ
jgi:hypothetical protein